MFLATLILNWNEDGKIYKERLQEKEDAPPPLNLNPWIRGFRLAFVLLFVGFDVGMIIYNKVSYDLINIFSSNTVCFWTLLLLFSNSLGSSAIYYVLEF